MASGVVKMTTNSHWSESKDVTLNMTLVKVKVTRVIIAKCFKISESNWTLLKHFMAMDVSKLSKTDDICQHCI